MQMFIAYKIACFCYISLVVYHQPLAKIKVGRLAEGLSNTNNRADGNCLAISADEL